MFNKLIKHKTDNKFIQLFRYTFVGGTAFIVDTSVLFMLVEFGGVYYLTAKVFSFMAGLTTNYLLSVFWVFNQRRVKNRMLEFAINAMIALVGLGINLVVLRFATENLGIYYLISNVFAAGVAFIWNFLAKKKILFTVKEKAV